VAAGFNKSFGRLRMTAAAYEKKLLILLAYLKRR
jgi:hypothetical protein